MQAADWFEYHAKVRPDVVFLRQDQRSLTYGEADRRANQWANALVSKGLKVGDRIAYLSTNSIEMGLMYMATAKAGIAPVMLNYRLAPREWLYILNDADCRAIYVRGQQYVAAIDKLRAELPGIETFIALDTPPPAGWIGMEEHLRGASVEKPRVEVGQDDIAHMMYTSGTTGQPKGAMITHLNIITHCEQAMTASSAARSPGLRALLTTPLYHAAGTHRIYTAAINGGTIVLMEHFEPNEFVRKIAEERINTCSMVPSIIQSLLDNIPDIAQRDFSSLQVIYYGAAPISESTLRRALDVFKCDLIQGYGQTESTGGIAYLTEVDHHKALAGRPELLQSTGRSVVLAELKVFDENDNEVPRGTVGELVVRGPNVMKGYWRNPEATKEVMRNGWLHTGDMAYMDEEGYVFLKDRLKDMIVSGGTNIYPREVENALMEHPGIADVAVIGIPDPKWGEAVMAVCVVRGNAKPSPEELIEFCRERLGGFKIPRRYEFVSELPRNASGKLLKRVLREPYWKDVKRGIA